MLVVIGAGGAFTSANGTWGFWDAIPRLVGIIVSVFLVFVGAVLLVVPEKQRPETLEAALRALVAGLKITLKTIESIARMILAQISKWEENRKLKREKE